MDRISDPVSKVFKKYYKDFVKALKEVKEDYITFYLSIITEGVIQDENDAKVKFPERLFAYEFYHQYRKIMESKKRKKWYKGKILNGEQVKTGKRFNAIKGKLKSFTPDLILHSSVSTIEDQCWICEIKMNHNPKAFDDLFKIGSYIENDVEFKYYIFLYVGNFENIDEEKAKMADYIRKHENDPENAAGFVNNTICFFYNPIAYLEKDKVTAEWLCNILLDAPKNTKEQ